MKKENKDDKDSRYDPHIIESMNLHVFLFCLVVFGMALDAFQIPGLPFWNALGLACWLMIFPALAVYADWKAMVERRRLIERFFPESYWSDD
jgi:hypothetical protein